MIAPRKVVPTPLTWSLAIGFLASAAGCGGSDSASSVAAPATAPASNASTLTESKPGQEVDRSADATSPASSKPSVKTLDTKKTAEAREAFQILTQPGTEGPQWDAAQQKLVALGADATPVLLEGLKSSNPIERETAATICALAGAAGEELQAALVTCLNDESSFVRANAAASLSQIPEHQTAVISTLTSMLADSDPQLRRMAAANLGAFGAEANVELPKLTAVLADDDVEVVTPVIQLLGRIGPQAVDAVPQLQKIAHEQDGEIKQAAEQALLLIQTDSEETGQPKN